MAPVGSIAALQGAATVTRQNTAQPLAANAPIFTDDVLETGPGAKLLVRFSDGTELTLGPKADVVIDEFVYNPNGGATGANRAALRVTGGAMRLVAGAVERVGGAKSITVSTAVGTIGIRGTDFFVEMNADHLAVALFSGFEIAVANTAGETVLRPGEGTDIWAQGTAAVTPSRPLIWNNERVNRALALVTLSSPTARTLPYAAPVAAADNAGDAFMQGTFKLDGRLRYESVDQAARPRNAYAATFRLRAAYETLAWNGLFAGIEGEFTRALAERRGDGVVNPPTLPVIADPDSETLNRAYVGWTMAGRDGMAGTRAVVGRQRLVYDNERWIGAAAFRQNDQTFDAATIETRALPHLALRYAYVDRVNRVLGNNPGGHWDSASHLMGATTDALPFGLTTAYAYLLDLAPVPRLSSATYGARYDALWQADAGLALGLEAELARQSNYAANSNRYALTYALLRPTLRWHDATSLYLGWEHLGSNGVDALQTPLATLHRHNGWADVFTTTPVNGLDDVHVRLTQDLPDMGFVKNPKLDVRYHDFHAARGGAHYGSEFDADVNVSLLARATLGLRFARYEAKRFDSNTTKLWLYVEMQY